MKLLHGMQIVTSVFFFFPVVVNSQQLKIPNANLPILVRPVAVELTNPYPMLLKSPSSEPQQYFQYHPRPPSNQQHHQTDNAYYDMYSSLDTEYLSSDEDIPYFDYYEYGGPPDYGGGSVGGGWYGPPPPQPPQHPTGAKPVKGKPKPKPPASGVGGGSAGGSGWSEGPVVSGEADKEKDKLTEIKDKWNSFIDKFKLKDKDKDKDKGKDKEPVKKPPATAAPTQPPTQGGGWGNGWGQPPIPQPPPWLGPSGGGGGGGGKPILEIWLGPLWGDDPSATLEETTTLFPTSGEETTTLKYNPTTVNNKNMPSPSVLK